MMLRMELMGLVRHYRQRRACRLPTIESAEHFAITAAQSMRMTLVEEERYAIRLSEGGPIIQRCAVRSCRGLSQEAYWEAYTPPAEIVAGHGF